MNGEVNLPLPKVKAKKKADEAHERNLPPPVKKVEVKPSSAY